MSASVDELKKEIRRITKQLFLFRIKLVELEKQNWDYEVANEHLKTAMKIKDDAIRSFHVPGATDCCHSSMAVPGQRCQYCEALAVGKEDSDV